MVPAPVNAQVLEAMGQLFVSLPHCETLGMRWHGTDGRQPTLVVDWKPELVGNPATGVLHGGVITSLVDTTSALAVCAHLPDFETIATLDLRIDYLSGARQGLPVYCTAECYRLASQVAFTRAVCWQETPEQPIAHGVATFMRGSSPIPMVDRSEP